LNVEVAQFLNAELSKDEVSKALSPWYLIGTGRSINPIARNIPMRFQNLFDRLQHQSIVNDYFLILIARGRSHTLVIAAGIANASTRAIIHDDHRS